MSLKRVLTLLILSLSFLLPPSEAQQAAKIPRVGFLAPQGRSLPLFDAFRQGLGDLGYIDGKNIVIEPPLPTLFAPSRVAAGGLLSYGTSQTEAIRHMAAYVDKVLKGAKPGALSVETVKRYELIVNLKTAREIGVTISPEVLKHADQVIQ
jgi:hypothetical protein